MTQSSATNRKSIRIAEKESAERDRTRNTFLAAAMDTAQGRLFFHDLLADCGVFHNTPCFEPNRDYFDMGQRNVGLRLQTLILTHCPDSYLHMLRDENERQHLSAARQQPGSPVANGRDSGSGPGPELDDEPDDSAFLYGPDDP